VVGELKVQDIVSVNIIEYDKDMEWRLHDMYDSQFYTGSRGIALLPKLGFIAFHDNRHVASMFLRQVEGGFAIMGDVVTDSRMLPEIRHEALDKLTEKCIETAKALNLKGLFCYTSQLSIQKRAEAAGFHTVNEVILAKKV
jgi:hypothetical protein